jgi:hypothetical protein
VVLREFDPRPDAREGAATIGIISGVKQAVIEIVAEIAQGKPMHQVMSTAWPAYAGDVSDFHFG